MFYTFGCAGCKEDKALLLSDYECLQYNSGFFIGFCKVRGFGLCVIWTP